MQLDTEVTPGAVDRQDHIPPSKGHAGQDQGRDELGPDWNVQAIVHTDSAGPSSTRPVSVASTQLQDAVRVRRSDEIQPDAPPSPALEFARADTFPSSHHQTALQSAYAGSYQGSLESTAQRTDVIGAEADAQVTVDQGDQAINEFLTDHFRDDIFSLDVQKMPKTAFWPILKPADFDFERLSKDAEPRVTMRLSLAALNRMRMRGLQIKLSRKIMRMHYFNEMPSEWEKLLQDYISAARDNDYIRTCVDDGLHDAFVIKSERNVDAQVLRACLLEIPSEKRERVLKERTIDDKKIFNFMPPLEQEPTAIGGTRTERTRKKRTEDFLKRVVSSVIGGAFLVVPMWLMILLNSQRASLITTSVFVFASGIVASYQLENPLSVLSTTAAYAAVLVVFVGTSGGTSGATA